ncbi:septum formation inhibitor MinC [Mesorhizobium sp. M1C.F.Ca.ET.193.01.1.1]|uniref:septum site-determining protein MinC n=1 Tax=unclassified Mesorhizobium TaxID=325217 RepID=UPI000FD42E8B|nr:MULTISPECIES: septum site-determining protein MinC [unclassified Mesorhizobium]TGS91956.1 septum formation inhibitor MinC [bacterium M00.F.Ca.ET.177.01.1.1]TGQ50044.1 septum formation inhibitor MinC [Mesorhizobium sp. M1C.F.Ca.ET.210.01.1.1]TGQ64738.1 septum formation inhibitor MinC [Mesorhizobium sp. M1C.F.Ca.ET.212.01.1.1]TGQ98354.1 septum formation inhibitor MinC [Mesorhizobium sp. M1C.F.Ca.ET.204.01.1.1]TGR18659.1 septum formation inhibitor MinC [Mesorhizobium sp. M1C.F.Ca.ET.196.01.1.1
MTFAAPLHNKSIRFRARSFVAFTLTPEAPIDEWLEGLDHWIGNSPGYFAGRPVVLDLNTLKPGPEEIAALVGVLGSRGIRVYAIELEGAELGPELPPLLGGAKEATAEGLLGRAARKAKAEEITVETCAVEDAQPGQVRAPQDDLVKLDEAKPEAAKPEPGRAVERHEPAAGTLMIKAPIRSGQSVFHPHGDVIVLGSVASGSEIVAGGSIHVYGTLRGRAIAGSEGNTSARIFCRKNEAELLAVDGWYTTAEEMEGVSRGKAVQAFLDNDALCVVPLG